MYCIRWAINEPGTVLTEILFYLVVTGRVDMSELDQLVKYVCDDCGLAFWAKPEDEPRFCPFCERAILTKIEK